MKLLNNYFILRHGESISNKENFVGSWPEKRYDPLTKKGEKQIHNIAKKLKKEKIDLIFSSDLLRTKQTSQITAQELNLKINFDKRLREINTGILNQKSIKQWKNYFSNKAEKFTKRPPKGENRQDVQKRLKSFIKDIDQKYKNKNILIVGHQAPLALFWGIIKNLSKKTLIKNWEKLKINNGELVKL